MYLWDTPPVSPFLAISNHVAAAAALSHLTTLSARARVNPLLVSRLDSLLASLLTSLLLLASLRSTLLLFDSLYLLNSMLACSPL